MYLFQGVTNEAGQHLEIGPLLLKLRGVIFYRVMAY